MPRIIGMVGGGLVLTLLLYLGLSFAGDPRPDDAGEPGIDGLSQEASMTPVTFLSVSEVSALDGPSLRIQGMAEPGSIIVLMDRGENVRQVRTDAAGQWTAMLGIPSRPMAIEAVMFDGSEGDPNSDPAQEQANPNPNAPRSVSIRGVETIFHIRRVTADSPDAPALILIISPGAPSRLIQSPFGGLPGSKPGSPPLQPEPNGEDGPMSAEPELGPLFIGPIDYDDAGGVIFSGLSSQPGRVRLYVANSAIGDTRIGPDGRWAYIASSVMPLGEYNVRAELIGSQAERVSVTVPFERLPPLETSDLQSESDEGALSVIFEPFQWQIRRSLIGGGSQSTVIVSPAG